MLHPFGEPFFCHGGLPVIVQGYSACETNQHCSLWCPQLSTSSLPRVTGPADRPFQARRHTRSLDEQATRIALRNNGSIEKNLIYTELKKELCTPARRVRLWSMSPEMAPECNPGAAAIMRIWQSRPSLLITDKQFKRLLITGSFFERLPAENHAFIDSFGGLSAVRLFFWPPTPGRSIRSLMSMHTDCRGPYLADTLSPFGMCVKEVVSLPHTFSRACKFGEQ